MSEETQISNESRFNIPKIKTLTRWLYPLSIIGFVLLLMGRIQRNNDLVSVAYGLNGIGIVLWCILWVELKKSMGSIVVHTIFALILGTLGIWGFLFILIATTQANTVIKHNGNVEVTFWNVKAK